MPQNSSVRHTRLSPEIENKLSRKVGAASTPKKSAEGGTVLRVVMGTVRRLTEEEMT